MTVPRFINDMLGKHADTLKGLVCVSGFHEKDPYRANWDEVARENAFLLKRVNFCACINMIGMSIVSPFLTGFNDSTLLYILSAVLTLAFGAYCHFWAHRFLKLVLPLFYTLLAALCAYSIALSSFLYPTIHGVTIVGIFMLIPMIVLDKTWRLNLILFVYYLISCVFALLNKPPEIAIDDCVTCVAFVAFGMLIGSYLRSVRMRAIVQQQQLKYQRDIDALTGLPNRRVLFETLGKIDQGKENAFLSGIIMADIDEFKSFNDHNGHQAGDDYLSGLGELFAQFALKNGISIYRYGGEEFLGLCLDKDREEMRTIAEQLVAEVKTRDILGAGMTLSAGFACRTKDECVSSETLISMADSALYEAKRQGRDRTLEYARPPEGGLQLSPNIRRRG